MSTADWANLIDLTRAIYNLNQEKLKDWHHDPWGWPELRYVAETDPALAFQHCASKGLQHVDLIEVPKENWGTRPAVVLDIADRLVYQAIVDRLSVDLIGDLSPNVFGWRLRAKSPKRGEYSHNNFQWEWYASHLKQLSEESDAVLCTDLVSFFGSIPIDNAQSEIESRTAKGAPTARLCDLLTGFQKIPDRSGIPQRSSASAVIANMYLQPLDDVMIHHAPSLSVPFSKLTYHGCARWMDDMWVFGNDPAAARRAQMDLQSVAQNLGLNLNYAKTEVFEGDEVAARVLETEHSAVDQAIGDKENFTPLEELIDRVLQKPEKVGRSTINFVSTRMRDNSNRYRLDDLRTIAVRMPHAADAWARLFKDNYPTEELQDWYLEYAQSDWATHQWSVAHYGRMFTSLERPAKGLIKFFSDAVRDANTSLPLLAVAAQRLCAWDPREGRSACRDAYGRASTPHVRRVLSLAALSAREHTTTIKRWINEDRENLLTSKMLEYTSYRPPRVQKDFLSY
jgi:reverse transcriptase-like protein